MTLPELCEQIDEPLGTMPVTDTEVGLALQRALQQGAAQGRLTCNLSECIEVLSTRPDDVMMCVLPCLATRDATATIHSTLIRAFCHEYDIRVISVDCDVKLAKSVHGSYKKFDSNANDVTSFSCVLVQFPQDGTSKDDEIVAEFYKAHIYGNAQKEPYIELPD